MNPPSFGVTVVEDGGVFFSAVLSPAFFSTAFSAFSDFSLVVPSSGGGVGRFVTRGFASASGSSRGRFVAPVLAAGTTPFTLCETSSGTSLSLTVRSASLRFTPFS